MRDFASFQRSHIVARNVRAPVREAAEKNRNMARRNRHELRWIFGLAHLPSALAKQPLDECDDSSGQAFIDRKLRNPRASVWLRHGQDDYVWLAIDRRSTAVQG